MPIKKDLHKRSEFNEKSADQRHAAQNPHANLWEYRQIGTGLMASAGIAGLAVGFAAKPVLGNIIAGLQIAVTQPIRLDDVVVVENEWGRIEEITGTYVVVRIWDERRLIVPLQYFIEQPFQNWTRKTSTIIGSVFFWVDYSMPVQPLRDELNRLPRLRIAEADSAGLGPAGCGSA